MPNIKYYYNGRWYPLYGNYAQNSLKEWKLLTSASQLYAPYAKEGDEQPTFWWKIKEIDSHLMCGMCRNYLSLDKVILSQWYSDDVTNQVSAGRDHLLFLKENKLYSCGNGTRGQIGNNNLSIVKTPQICGLGYYDWSYCSAGEYVSFAIRNGILYGTGANETNIFGTGQDKTQFVVLDNNKYNLCKCDCWAYHCMSISKDKKLYAYGNELGTNGGYCGLGQTARNITSLTKITRDDNGNDISEGWEDIAVGELHSVGIRNGKLYACGRNESYQLGTSEDRNEDKYYMTEVDTQIDDWVSVSCGEAFSMAIRANGDLYAWGSNSYGQLGLGQSVVAKKPTFVGSGFDWVRCGYQHVIACKYHDLYVWGRNTTGQLGDSRPTGKNQYLPQRMEKVSGDTQPKNYWWRLADAGYRITIAIKE